MKSITASRLGLLLALAAASCVLPASGAARRPPTVDPTYGLVVPPAPAPAPPAPGASAHWIWTATVRSGQAIGVRRAFSLTRAPASATLLVTADNYFTAYLNGHRIGGTTESDGDYAWRTAHSYQVASHLRTGRNVLAIEGRNATGAAGIVAALVMPPGVGARQIVTSADWRAMDSPPSGWQMPGFNAGAWPAATSESPLGGGPWAALAGWPGLSPTPAYLRHLTVPPAAVIAVSPGLGAVTGAATLTRPGQARLVVTPPPSGTAEASCPSVMLDFGREITGQVRIASASHAPVQITLRYGESQDEALFGPYTGIQKLELPPGGAVEGLDSAYRFAKITFLAGPSPIHIRAITCQHVYYPVRYLGSFDCSDPLLTKIWYTGAYTCHLCMQSDIWDAPKRDRMRWMGDLQVSGEVINDVFADRFLMEQTLDRLRADAGSPPHSHVNGIPGYSCAWVVGMADFFRHTGDLAFLKKHHDDLISLMDYFHAELDARGLFADRRGQWPFVDWSPNFNGKDPHALKATHFYMVLMLKDGAWLLRQMGDRVAAERYDAWARSATAAAQKYLLDLKTQTFGHRWQENAMAIYAGVATPKQRQAIWRQVLSVRYPERLMITPYYNDYCITAMSLSGHTTAALQFVRDYWGGMIREGATTFWEGYDPRWPKQHYHRFLQADNGQGYFVSLSHGWSAGATSWLTEQVLGVRSAAAGFRRVEIRPHLADLAWAQGAVPTPRGLLRASYRKTGRMLNANLSIPPGTVARVTLPGAAPQTLGPGRHHLVARLPHAQRITTHGEPMAD